jgi:hypothetical protein
MFTMWNSSRSRPIPQTYEVSAVRRPKQAAAPVAVAGEEIVDALLRNRRTFQRDLARRLDKRFIDCEVVGVVLRDVRPAGSVLVELVFHIKSRQSLVKLSVGFSAGVMAEVGKLLLRVLREPVAVSVAPAAKRRGKAAAPKSGSGWATITPVLAAIASGIGVIGFVTFVGGLFVWARLNGNGLPAAPTLSVYPKQDLLVIGASTLVPQVLVALAVAVGLTVIYLLLRLVPRVRERELLALAGHTVVPTVVELIAVLAIVLAVIVFLVICGVKTNELLFVVPGVLISALLAGLLGLVTRRFAYLATTAFLALGVLMSYVAYRRARDDKQVRGAALIRSGQTAITGIWLTEGAGRVFLALPGRHPDGSVDQTKSRVIGVDKREVTDVAIAAAKPPRSALLDAQTLKADLCIVQKNGGCGPG